MSLLHKVHNQRLRNWIILAVALLAAIAIISPEQLGVTLYKLSLDFGGSDHHKPRWAIANHSPRPGHLSVRITDCRWSLGHAGIGLAHPRPWKT